jgi:hypothetical protein
MAFGFVYCLENYLAFPGLYKIGHTGKSPHQRAADLSTTGVPQPFSVVGYIEIENPQAWEGRFHRYLTEYRCNAKREFFKAPMSVIAPLFLMNEYASATVDIDFSPALYVETRSTDIELPNPYHTTPWLNGAP